LQQPLLSGFGGGLEIAEQPDELYRRAARETLRKIDQAVRPWAKPLKSCCCGATTAGRRWKSCWSKCSKSRDRWMHGFVLEREPDWDALRERLERPFANAVRAALARLSQLLDQVPGSARRSAWIWRGLPAKSRE
jgi:ATP-dependent helicase/nuclease subunit A